jgi:hypothetical protein
MPYAARLQAPGGHRVARGLFIITTIAVLAFTALAIGYVVYVLWPRWPAPNVAADAPSLPVTVAGVTFNIPPAAIRQPVQRRPGAQERIDLAFLWPSLLPPQSAATASASGAAGLAEAARPSDRLFATIFSAATTLAPDERLRTIYPRYIDKDALLAQEGLIALAFRRGTPYESEELVYDAETPEQFWVRCMRKVPGPTGAMCLYERRIGEADIVVRFPREWLNGNWRLTAAGIERLIASLRPHTD